MSVVEEKRALQQKLKELESRHVLEIGKFIVEKIESDKQFAGELLKFLDPHLKQKKQRALFGLSARGDAL